MVDRPLDVALLVPSWSDEEDWAGLAHVYVHQRPVATGAGARVWLCKDRRLFRSYRIDAFVDLHDVGEEGWALAVSDGRPTDRPLDDIPDPNGVARRWRHGFRYLAPGAGAFVRAQDAPSGQVGRPPAD